MEDLLQLTDRGLYCPDGDFYIDPWQPVDRAVITHAHSDHARWGMSAYLAAEPSRALLETRLAPGSTIETLPYGHSTRLNGTRISLHPAGHVLGSAQVRIEKGGQVWVVTGDYKTEPDATCESFDLQRCHTLVTESTFGLPIYRWRPQSAVFAEINDWWRSNAEEGVTSLLFGYALGKAQRLMAGVDQSIGPMYCHGAVERISDGYRAGGVPLPECPRASGMPRGTDWSRALIIAPPSANGTPWVRKFGRVSTGFASGWMQIRGTRRRRAVDRGFVLSDHVDWPALMDTISGSGAESIWVTHGYTGVVVRWLLEQGLDAKALATPYSDDLEEAESVESEE